MLDRRARFVLGALLTCGACQDAAVTPADLTVVPPDLAMAPSRPHPTIRELNNLTVATGTQITVSGVIIGPLTYVTVGADKKSCSYTVYIGQPDPTPTLHDGIAVVFNRAEDSGDMALTLARWQDRGHERRD